MPSVPVAAVPRAAPKDDDYPSLLEGFSTVGLMLWPGKGGELLVTGFMEGHSAENCGLETGDIIIKVDDTSVEGMAASVAAERMAGPTGSAVTVTTSRSTKTANSDGSLSITKTTHTASITRDVSSDQANKKTQESLASVIYKISLPCLLLYLSITVFPTVMYGRDPWWKNPGGGWGV